MPGVLIVDDHAHFRTMARSLLEAQGWDVVGEAHDGASALAAVDRLSPGVVLLDVQLPDLDGFAVAARLALLAQPPAVVLISSRDGSVYRERLRDCAARGFLAKTDLSGAALAALVA